MADFMGPSLISQLLGFGSFSWARLTLTAAMFSVDRRE
jgi:hypothetical protein